MPRVDYLPPEIGIPLALILWAIVFFMFYGRRIRNNLDDFFAQRRHNRREKRRLERVKEAEFRAMQDYLERDLELTTSVYRQGLMTPNKARAAAGYQVSEFSEREIEIIMKDYHHNPKFERMWK